MSAGPAIAKLRFEPPLISQAVGSTVAFNVTLDSVAAVHSLSMQLRYDPAAMQLLNVVSGGYLSRDGQAATLVHRDAGDGKLQVSAVRPPGAPGVNGQGTVFTLIFQLKTPGSSSIAPVGMMARDASGNPIVTNAAGQASVQIQPPPAAK
ncbi:MAG: cohesin domain-containing protein [Acidimicrobiales bacterium]